MKTNKINVVLSQKKLVQKLKSRKYSVSAIELFHNSNSRAHYTGYGQSGATSDEDGWTGSSDNTSSAMNGGVLTGDHDDCNLGGTKLDGIEEYA